MIRLISKIARWAVGSLLITLFLWVVIGNIVANQKRKAARAQLEKIVEARLVNLPTYNDAALKLIELTAPLGISLGNGDIQIHPIDNYLTKQINFVVSSEKQLKLRNLQDKASTYFEGTLFTSDDNLAPLPDEISEFLTANQSIIRAIQAQLANGVKPTWGFPPEYLKGFLDPNINTWELPLPSRLDLVNLEKILVLQVISDDQSGNKAAVTKGLKASWNLADSVNNDSTLISPLIRIIISNYMIVVERKLINYIPDDSSAKDFSQRTTNLLHQALELEGGASQYSLAEYLSNAPVAKILSFDFETWASPDERFSLRWLNILRPIIQPYLFLSAINTWEVFTTNSDLAKGANICEYSSFATEIYGRNLGLWNSWTTGSVFDFYTQEHKAVYQQLAAELNHHILSAKRIKKDTGKWPSTLSNLESKICPGETWLYKVETDGTLSITLSAESEYLQDLASSSPTRPTLDFRGKASSGGGQ